MQLEVYNILRNLNPRKASGPDGIPNWLLRDHAELLTVPVCSILNSSYQEMKLPTVLSGMPTSPLYLNSNRLLTLISISNQFL